MDVTRSPVARWGYPLTAAALAGGCILAALLATPGEVEIYLYGFAAAAMIAARGAGIRGVPSLLLTLFFVAAVQGALLARDVHQAFAAFGMDSNAGWISVGFVAERMAPLLAGLTMLVQLDEHGTPASLREGAIRVGGGLAAYAAALIAGTAGVVVLLGQVSIFPPLLYIEQLDGTTLLGSLGTLAAVVLAVLLLMRLRPRALAPSVWLVLSAVLLIGVVDTVGDRLDMASAETEIRVPF